MTLGIISAAARVIYSSAVHVHVAILRVIMTNMAIAVYRTGFRDLPARWRRDVSQYTGCGRKK